MFEHGSFLQSRMARAGVTCVDCHDPHTGKTRAEGNALCTGCHDPEVFDTSRHHHHQSNGAGAACVSCHMPTRTYMQVHVRHDHAIRVPRPDWSVRFKVPNACTVCHGDRDASWAARTVADWYGAPRRDASVETLMSARARW